MVLYNTEGFGKVDFYFYNLVGLTISVGSIGLSYSLNYPFVWGCSFFLLISHLNSRKLWRIKGVTKEINFQIAYDILRRDLEEDRIGSTSNDRIVGRFSSYKMFNLSILSTQKVGRQLIVILDENDLLINSSSLVDRFPNPIGLVNQLYLGWFLITVLLEVKRKKGAN